MVGSKAITTLTALLLILIGFSGVGVGQKRSRPPGNPILWRDPGDVSRRDLHHGPGSNALAPQGPFTFVEEVKGGASPKFSVTDRQGVTWVVKLGEEAQSETVASRLIWAVGYFAEEAYFFERVDILKLPTLSRGSEHVTGPGTIKGARFEPRRPDVIRGENWEWRENPFVGTRELDGLKVMMVLLANYDTSPQITVS